MTHPSMRRAVRLILGAAAFMALGIGAFADAGAGASAPARANRLAGEKSPYLRLHAANPVDWYPWGPEAFEKARKENKPIFLSIGYSTCHWCHVMERETFSNPEVAAVLNSGFVAVLVDREERPDIDRLYMTFVQASTGGGGWPLSVWLTPDLKPFLGGTYFAPSDEAGRPGFKSVLARVAAMWSGQREQVLENSDKIIAALEADTRSAATAGALPVAALRGRVLAQAAEAFDAEHGGFEQAPKFPQPALLEFLLDVSATTPDAAERDKSLRMVLKTLREMDAGGIHDHLGGGFHRYSVDAAWRVPHFEKMLYDQAQLACAYLEAWQVSSDPALKGAARDTLDYVRRDLTDPAGGFYSAEDADSALASRPASRAEGAFYVWTAAEIEGALGSRDAALASFAFGVEPGGNVPGDESGELAGENVLFRAHTGAECAAKFGTTEEAARSATADAARRLGAARGKRPRPARDDKIITAWNGLMISAYARAAQALGDPGCAASAERAASFLKASLFDPSTGRLARSYRSGVRDERGFAEDYAFLVQGLLDLYEATFDVRWLDWAAKLQEKQDELFWDPAAGGYFANAAGDASVLLRLKDDSDGVEPSANSVSLRNLARLSELLNRAEWRERAVRTARAFGPDVDRSPLGLPLLMAAAGWLVGSPKEVLIHGEPGSPDTARLVAEAWRRYLPRRVLLLVDRESRGFFAARMPLVADLPAEGGGAMGYVCENFVCQLPTRDPAAFARLLAGPARAGPP